MYWRDMCSHSKHENTYEDIETIEMNIEIRHWYCRENWRPRSDSKQREDMHHTNTYEVLTEVKLSIK